MPSSKNAPHDLIILGGGAAGLFAALAAKTAHPSSRVLLLEKTAVLLAKVRISGGGRCNVTHACFDPKQLIENYPRGSRELLGPFHHFGPKDTVQWFQEREVLLKTEKDGRMFPITDCSETIIHCLLEEAKKLGVEIRLKERIQTVEKKDGIFSLNGTLFTHRLLLATGSSRDGYILAQSLGHSLIEPVPSLFTFNVPTSPLLGLSGISLPLATLTLPEFKLSQTGPLLLTHFGFSGPAVLKLSAWGARSLHHCHYKTFLLIEWPPLLPKNLAKAAPGDLYQIDGKTTHKEEFVTCGGIPLKEVDFRTLESKLCPGLYFAGEILDIDGITGGFNFQNAWTTGFIAGRAAGGGH